MIQTKQVLNLPKRSVKSLRRSERHEMHRSADAFLAMEQMKETLNQAKVTKPTNIIPTAVTKYLTLLADGLEQMFGTIIK